MAELFERLTARRILFENRWMPARFAVNRDDEIGDAFLAELFPNPDDLSIKDVQDGLRAVYKSGATVGDYLASIGRPLT